MSVIAETSLTSDQGYIALRSNTIDIIKQNLKNQPLSFQLFDTVKAPSGGTTVFTIPGIAGDEVEKSITGIILDYTTPRAYWETTDPIKEFVDICPSEWNFLMETSLNMPWENVEMVIECIDEFYVDMAHYTI